MKGTISALLAVSLIGAAAAGTISNRQTIWLDTTPLDSYTDSWDSQVNGWELIEEYGQLGSSAVRSVGMADSGGDVATNGMTQILVDKYVTNFSSFEWTGYEIAVGGSAGVSYVAGSMTSDRFGTIVEVGNTITLSAPLSVPVGDTVHISFVVDVPDGQFTFDISQTPIPEPMTAILMVLALPLIRRR